MDTKSGRTPASKAESFITCRNSQGVEVRATPLRLGRHLVVFEVYNPYSILQLSEVLHDFSIVMNERLVYSGRAVVSNMVNTGILLVCEATLDDCWLDVDLFSAFNHPERLQSELTDFLREWERIYAVLPQFKVVVADIQSLLMDLRRWFEQVELRTRSMPSADRAQTERETLERLGPPLLPVIGDLFCRFEAIACTIDEDLSPVHRSYMKRQMHPLVLCAPFAFRTVQKPLGYAGDYEMVNMILRDPLEGSSLFAKTVNWWFLSQAPAVAHRNRIQYLGERIVAEAGRVASKGHRLRVFNLGCGPAGELQNFLSQHELSDQADLTLLDFNDETLAYTQRVLSTLTRQHGRTARVEVAKRSVHQLLKERWGGNASQTSYDLVYCAGLFDYLSDRICRRLMELLYGLVAPGGLLIATNVSRSNPLRNVMEYVLEWHLVYRDADGMRALTPDGAQPQNVTVKCDETGVNLFVEVRKADDHD
jgi:extracellular factor (EF) 3-hydroxypalmitic acid methyl ester biosynthesis protein